MTSQESVRRSEDRRQDELDRTCKPGAYHAVGCRHRRWTMKEMETAALHMNLYRFPLLGDGKPLTHDLC